MTARYKIWFYSDFDVISSLVIKPSQNATSKTSLKQEQQQQKKLIIEPARTSLKQIKKKRLIMQLQVV